MTRNVLKFLNRHFGTSVLRLIRELGVLTRAVSIGRKHNTETDNHFKNILAVKIVGMGDTILMLPSLKWLKQNYKNARLYVLATPLSAGILKTQPFIDEVIEYHIFGRHKGIAGLFRIISELRKKKIDLVIDYEQHIKLVTIISYFSGARKIIGFNNPQNRRDYLLTDSIAFDDNIHMAEAFNDLITPLGFNGKIRTLEKIFTAPQDILHVSRWLEEQGIAGDDIVVGIHAGSGKTAVSRRWPEERFAELADRIVKEYGAKIVLTGTSDEFELIENIAGLMENLPITAVDQFTIKQLPALIERFDLLITNDTGPMHIGPAMGTLTIGLFGPQDPTRYKPFGEGHVAVYKKISCSPCINVHVGQVPECKEPLCIKSILVDEVWQIVQSRMITLSAVSAIPDM